MKDQEIESRAQAFARSLRTRKVTHAKVETTVLSWANALLCTKDEAERLIKRFYELTI
jgi:acetylornithine/succinyldiaminopimelate/putrescine aminotransferase